MLALEVIYFQKAQDSLFNACAHQHVGVAHYQRY